MDPLAKYRKTRGRPRTGCRACGSPEATARIQVVIQERQPNPKGSGHHYPALASSSAAFCPDCAAKMYDEYTQFEVAA